jgi:hypothetical protein
LYHRSLTYLWISKRSHLICRTCHPNIQFQMLSPSNKLARRHIRHSPATKRHTHSLYNTCICTANCTLYVRGYTHHVLACPAFPIPAFIEDGQKLIDPSVKYFTEIACQCQSRVPSHISQLSYYRVEHDKSLAHIKPLSCYKTDTVYHDELSISINHPIPI